MKKIIAVALILFFSAFLALPTNAQAGGCHRYQAYHQSYQSNYKAKYDYVDPYVQQIQLLVVQPVYEVQAPVDYDRVERVVEVKEISRVRVEKVRHLTTLLQQLNGYNLNQVQKVIINKNHNYKGGH